MTKSEKVIWETNINKLYDAQFLKQKNLSELGFKLATRADAGLPEIITGTTIASREFEYSFKSKVIELGKYLNSIHIASLYVTTWQVPQGFIPIDESYSNVGLLTSLKSYKRKNPKFAIMSAYYRWYHNEDWGKIIQGWMPCIRWGQ